MINDKKNFDNQLNLVFASNQLITEKGKKVEELIKNLKIIKHTIKKESKALLDLETAQRKDMFKLEELRKKARAN